MAQPTSRSLWHLIESIAVAMGQWYGLMSGDAIIFAVDLGLGISV